MSLVEGEETVKAAEAVIQTPRHCLNRQHNLYDGMSLLTSDRWPYKVLSQ